MPAHESAAAVSRVQLGHRRIAPRGAVYAVAVLAWAAVVVTHLLDFGTEQLHSQLLDASSSASWSHRLVAAILVAATVAGLIGAWRSPRHRGLWIAATLILAFLAVDELTALHAHVDRLSWGKALYAPILAGLGICLWRLAAGTEERTALAIGLTTLAVSFVIHVFGGHVVQWLGWSSDGWAYQVKVALKEGTQLAGWLLVGWVLWRLAVTSIGSGARNHPIVQ